MDEFQSTFPRGERLNWWNTSKRNKRVSIHVPTRGTTLQLHITAVDRPGFNPRSHEGNDLKHLNIIVWFLKFQSTFPRGERRTPRGDQSLERCFNPRSHEGNDGERWKIAEGKQVSIHVPTRGTTGQDSGSSTGTEDVSIHVPTRGTTRT